MKRILTLGAVALLTFLVSTPARAFDWKDIAQMQRDGISDELVLEKIQHSGKVFHLDADDLHELKSAGVSDKVLTAMLRTEDQEDLGYDHPQYAYPYPVHPCVYRNPYYGPRVSLNFGFGRGFGGHGYGGGCRPFGGGHGFGGHGGGHGGWRR